MCIAVITYVVVTGNQICWILRVNLWMSDWFSAWIVSLFSAVYLQNAAIVVQVEWVDIVYTIKHKTKQYLTTMLFNHIARVLFRWWGFQILRVGVHHLCLR